MKISTLLRQTADAIDENITFNTDAILVWPGDSIPQWILNIIDDHSDIDWVAFIPDKYRDKWFGWMDSGASFGCCDVKKYEAIGGYIAVGHHA